MADIAFVTGATGFVGSAVVRLLLQKKNNVRVLARSNGDRRNIEGLPVEIIEGDLLNPDSYREALKGCRGLFHVAADYRIWVPNPAEMNKVNVDGTRALMEAALEAQIPRIVYTSSVATIGTSPIGLPGTEDLPVKLTDMVGKYKKSKFLAEQEVLKMVKEQNLPAVIVNPSTPIGPRDIKPTPTGRIIVNALNGLIPAYVNTGLNVVHVEDVAWGHWCAYKRGTVGERYIIGGTDITLKDILAIVAKIGNHRAPTIQLPIFPLYPLALIFEAVARIRKNEPMLTVDALRMAQKKMYFSSEKAERELDYMYRPPDYAIRDAIEWFQRMWYC